MSMISSGCVLLLSLSTVRKRFSTVCGRIDGQHSCYWSSSFFTNLACPYEKVDSAVFSVSSIGVQVRGESWTIWGSLHLHSTVSRYIIVLIDQGLEKACSFS